MSEITYEVHSLPQSVSLLIELDRNNIDPSMFLDEHELSVISKSNGFAILCYNGDTLLGGAYAMPSTEVEDILQEVDGLYQADPDQLYIYSVVVEKGHRQQGIGTTLRKEILQEGARRHFLTGATHARDVRGWAESGRSIYQPFERRQIRGYWPSLENKDVEFQLFNI